MEERLQKIISRAGIASRRAGEEIILAGRVRVNGRVVTELGAKADLGRDTVEVDGRRLVHETMRYLVLHKPRGVVSTLKDPEGRPTVAGLLEGAGTRLYPVGRLDFATSGVLLVTNDGDFANGLLHPRGGVPKTYVCKAKGIMTEDDLDHWRKGVRLDDGPTLEAEVHFLRHEEDKTWFEITLREGRNQQIRRMGEATGFPVMRLARLSFAGVTSEGLRPGEWRPLRLEELLAIREQFGVPKRVRAAATAAAAAPREGSARPRARPARGPRREGKEAPARPARPAGAAEARFQRPERAPAPRPGPRAPRASGSPSPAPTRGRSAVTAPSRRPAGRKSR
jgi:23S rRNA pseudouridine2605 synthase